MINIRKIKKKSFVYDSDVLVGELFNVKYLNFNNELILASDDESLKVRPYKGKLLLCDIDSTLLVISEAKYNFNVPYLGLNQTFIRIIGQC